VPTATVFATVEKLDDVRWVGMFELPGKLPNLAMSKALSASCSYETEHFSDDNSTNIFLVPGAWL